MKKLLDENLKGWIQNKIQLIIPTAVILGVAAVVAVSLWNHNEVTVAAEQQSAIDAVAVDEVVVAVSSENPLEVDLYPELNQFIVQYLTALADGNVEVISSMSNNVSDTEVIRIQELGAHIEAFPEYNIFTKKGPVENSYIVYAAARAKMPGLETLLPGIYSFYVCTNDSGNFYLNEGTLTEEESSYIAALESDSAVIELLTSIDTEYNELLTTNEEVKTYMDVLQNEIKDAVGTAIATGDDAVAIAAADEVMVASSEAVAEVDETILATSAIAKVTTTINVRASDSEAADKVGKLEQGTTIEVIEMKVNGWSKFMFEGVEAYVKTDYLQVVAEAATEEANGMVTATTNVNVRAEASADAERLGQVDAGTQIEWIEDVNEEFAKVIYNGSIGYVALEYVTK